MITRAFLNLTNALHHVVRLKRIQFKKETCCGEISCAEHHSALLRAIWDKGKRDPILGDSMIRNITTVTFGSRAQRRKST